MNGSAVRQLYPHSLDRVLTGSVKIKRKKGKGKHNQHLSLTNLTIMSSSAAIGAQLSNLRAAIPPPLRTICFPDNLSIFLRNTITAIGVLNICLFFAAILTWPSRYLGRTTMMVSVVSIAHITYVSIILGNHLVHGIPPHQIQVGGFVDQLKSMSARYQSVFAHGTAFGSTAFMALLMHVVWAYFARVNDCVVNLDNRIQHAYNVTRHVSPTHTAIDNVNHLICGAYGPVGFVSFISGILYWLNLSLAIALYVERRKLFGDNNVDAMHGQYEEIHSDLNLSEEEVNNDNGMRVMQV